MPASRVFLAQQRVQSPNQFCDNYEDQIEEERRKRMDAHEAKTKLEEENLALKQQIEKAKDDKKRDKELLQGQLKEADRKKSPTYFEQFRNAGVAESIAT